MRPDSAAGEPARAVPVREGSQASVPGPGAPPFYFEAGGRRDEAFSQDLIWERTAMLVSAERGDLDNEFIEITEEEANQLVARIRADVAGAKGT